MDLSHLSDDELEQIAGSGKYRRVIDPKTYQPTQADIQEAMQATGTGDYASGLDKFNYGLVKSGADTGNAIRQGFNYVTGDTEELDRLKQEQQESNALFDRYGGTEGTVGNLTGSIAQSIVPGLGATKLLKGAGAVKNLVVGGGVTGVVEGALTPLDTESSFTGNVLQSGLLGAGFGGGLLGLGYVGKGALKALHNISPKNKADSVFKDYVTAQTQNMTDEQSANFSAYMDNVLAGNTVDNLTPGQAMGAKGSIDAQADLITSDKALNKFKNYNDQQKRDIVDSLRLMADTYPNQEVLSKAKPSDLTEGLIGNIKKQRTDATRPLYTVMETIPVKQEQLDILLKNPQITDYLKSAANSKEIPVEIRDKLRALREGTNNLTVADVQQLYVNTGNVLSKVKNKDIKVKVRGGFDSVLGEIPEFKAANAAYTIESEALNKLKTSEKLLKNNPQSIFDISLKNRADTEGLVNWMRLYAPKELKQISAQRLVNTAKTIGDDTTKGWQRKTIEQLDRIAEVNDDPVINEVVAKLKTGLTIPANKINRSVKPDNLLTFGGISNLFSSGASYVPVVSSLVGKLRQEKYQEALVELLFNPQKWAPLAKQSLTKKDGISELLTTIANTLSGTAGGATVN